MASQTYCHSGRMISWTVFVGHDAFPWPIFVDENMIWASMGRVVEDGLLLQFTDDRFTEKLGDGRLEKSIFVCSGKDARQ
jgi:hypothetical protein